MPKPGSDQGRGGYANIDLLCEAPAKRVVERLDEPILECGDCRLFEGSPCILFEDWDYAEDWSGEFVQVIPPETLIGAPRLSAPAFWTLVRKVHALAG